MSTAETATGQGTGPGEGADEGADAGATERGRVPAWRILLHNPITVTAFAVLVVVLFLALFGRFLIPYGINATNVTDMLQPPSPEHWFGTDELGRDLFSRVIAATSVSMQVAIVSVTFALVVGVLIGLVSGYVGGVVDTILMRVVDVMFAFPMILLALAVIAILGPGLYTTMLAVGVVYTPIFARVSRASALSASLEPYVQVSRTMGTGHGRILVRHVLPNITGPVIVQTSISLAFAILSEATLSFLGLGIQPPQPSWGRMIFDAQGFLNQAWWMSVFPGIAIFLSVLAFNLIGDGLRDVIDPRQRTLMETRIRT